MPDFPIRKAIGWSANNPEVIVDKYEGHDEHTAPKAVDGKGFSSPATYVPLADQATSVNSKRPEGVKSK